MESIEVKSIDEHRAREILCSGFSSSYKKKENIDEKYSDEMRIRYSVHISLNCMFVAVVARMAILLHASAIFVSTQHVEGNLLP